MEQQSNLAEELEKLGDIEVGDVLRRARTHYGQSLQDIEKALRIRESQIDAIEKGLVDQLPGRVYAIGFVRTYAEYLGLDGDKIVHLFKAQYMDAHPSRAQPSFPVAASETRTPPWWLVLVSVLVAAGIFGVWTYKATPDRRSIETIAPVPQEITQRMEEEVLAPQSASPSVEQEEEMSMAAPEPAVEVPKGIILDIAEKSWVEIRDKDGKAIVSNVLNKGDQYFVPDSPGLTMSLGNAGGVEITLNGRKLKPLGKVGDVRRDIPLDTDYLKTLEFEDDAASMPPDEALLAPEEGVSLGGTEQEE
ncbi:MAG: helix-turn-helix domain-containing protein [Alphaproteobacteria bacterium]|nr:helix-turn-helix domain-containing protein [Alphaproteobacteria bacterium]